MSTETSTGGEAAPDSRGKRVRVTAVVEETADARSFVVEPVEGPAFGYRAGQFLTVRVPDAGTGSARCYSLSSSPHCDQAMKFTVKRVRGGHGSSWLCDTVTAGAELDVLPPAGTFTPASLDQSAVLVAGGSGITPVIAIAKSILFGGSGNVVLLYANRDEASVIFAAELAALESKFPDRFTVLHLLESLQGYPSRNLLTVVLRPFADRDVYLCGPEPLMDLAAEVCASVGITGVHSERFLSLRQDPFAPAESGTGEVACTVRVSLEGEDHVVPWKAGEKLLDALLAAGVDAPYSCREGACSACVCAVTEGKVHLARNEILAEDDLAEGYVLACQAEPVSAEIAIEY
ncbi:ferredoxin--NADP reductase [Amycolatopsis rubida]|uniref:Ferredoxin--NADP reductase n=1 Tax=Amycolatopsis rubida TaxID=112413 RepID=A0ABX0BUB6_9PSEU|nr:MULTISPECIES: ferredoxin--NADP reductase [Amycolatopsis]MYW93536.1 2Fe-2S iron-sulfur cluster binding domain-containing protein [Amycolatopsis rubida]NEC58523.1 ferredoxin--NADP reductase [Amycolatopsis rubida]OAP25433.1 3-ketosteroid-9-alpha-hydroxylase reductase subunit [Amycolatopsis sp. M39]